MILYHFCAAHMVHSILESGLTLGACVVLDGVSMSFIKDCQWLTSEKDREKQSWATSHTIPYDRTAYRLTIHIPDSREKRLVKARHFVHSLPQPSWEIVDAWEGSDQWYIFRGKIPAKWIVGCRPQAQ